MSPTWLAATSSSATSRELEALRVECKRCGRAGYYNVHKLIEKHGRKGNLTKWMSDLRADCPKRDAPSFQERCDMFAPDLPKVL
jgi:hypothetical protein